MHILGSPTHQQARGDRDHHSSACSLADAGGACGRSDRQVRELPVDDTEAEIPDDQMAH